MKTTRTALRKKNMVATRIGIRFKDEESGLWKVQTHRGIATFTNEDDAWLFQYQYLITIQVIH